VYLAILIVSSITDCVTFKPVEEFFRGEFDARVARLPISGRVGEQTVSGRRTTKSILEMTEFTIVDSDRIWVWSSQPIRGRQFVVVEVLS